VNIVDPLASSEEVEEEYGVSLSEQPEGKYDAIVIAVPHDAYKALDENYFINLANQNCLVADLKNMHRGKISQLDYWTL
jgi:UDP-N-acetyl-D-galactosamine dehydrogenase